MFASFGWIELLLILIIVLIVFGAGKLAQLGEGVGKAIIGFKRSVNEAETDDTIRQEEAPQTRSQPRQSAGPGTDPTIHPEGSSWAGPQDSKPEKT
jgi:sec-independent protein translocase protein TatA